MHALGYQPGVKTILFYIKCSTNLCKTFRSIKEIAIDTSTVISTKTFLMMQPFGTLLCILTSVYFALQSKTKFKDSSLRKDSKYIQVYIVPYKNLGVTGVEIQSCNLSHS